MPRRLADLGRRPARQRPPRPGRGPHGRPDPIRVCFKCGRAAGSDGLPTGPPARLTRHSGRKRRRWPPVGPGQLGGAGLEKRPFRARQRARRRSPVRARKSTQRAHRQAGPGPGPGPARAWRRPWRARPPLPWPGETRTRPDPAKIPRPTRTVPRVATIRVGSARRRRLANGAAVRALGPGRRPDPGPVRVAPHSESTPIHGSPASTGPARPGPSRPGPGAWSARVMRRRRRGPRPRCGAPAAPPSHRPARRPAAWRVG